MVGSQYLLPLTIIFSLFSHCFSTDWNNFQLPDGLKKAKQQLAGVQSDLPWWHVNSAARVKEQNVAARTCGNDCSGIAIDPLCVGVKGQKQVFHQFWNRCEYDNYLKCKNKVGNLMHVVAHDFCDATVTQECRIDGCSNAEPSPVCAKGDPNNEDYTYANACFYQVAKCVGRVNRGASMRMQVGRCAKPNPHRFPSNFHRNWFIKL